MSNTENKIQAENKKLQRLLIDSMNAFVDISRNQNYQAQAMAEEIQSKLKSISDVDVKINW